MTTLETVLVTAISGDVGHGVLKCLTGSGRRLLGCDVNDYPVGLDRVETFVKVPYASQENEYLHCLENCIRTEKVTTLVPVNEAEIRLVGRERERFEQQGVRVLVHGWDLLETCLDKYALAGRLRAAGLDSPESFLPEDFQEDGREFLAKLRFSSGSRLLRRFKSKAELKAILAESDQPIVVQEYLPSEDSEYTVGVFSDGAEVRSIAFRRKLRHGYSQFVELVEDPALARVAEGCARLFGLRGSFNIQLRREEGRDCIFEINPRLSGTVYFRHQLGFTDARWWLDLAEGRPLPPYSPLYHRAIGIREMNEKFLLRE